MIKKVLSIQGSGTLVLGALLILEYIEEVTGKRIAELFDAIEGGSSGALVAFMLTVPNEIGKPKYTAREVSEFITYWHKLIMDYENSGFPTNKSGYKTLIKVYDEIFGTKILDEALKPVYGYSIKYTVIDDEIKLFCWSSVCDSKNRLYKDAALSVTALPSRYVHNIGKEYHIDAFMASYHSFIDIADKLKVIFNDISILKLSASDVHQISVSAIEKEFLQNPSSFSFNQLKPSFITHIYKAGNVFVTEEIQKHFAKTSTILDYNFPKKIVWMKLSAEEIKYSYRNIMEKPKIIKDYFDTDLIKHKGESKLDICNIKDKIELIISKSLEQENKKDSVNKFK